MPVQNKPIIHGRDHETDGADPIRGLLPGGDDLLDVMLALGAIGVWPLDETSGTVAHDRSGNDRHLLVGTDSPPTWGQEAGPPGSVTAGFSDPAQRLSYDTFPPLTGGDFSVVGWAYYTDDDPADFYALMGHGTLVSLGGGGTDGWLLGIPGSLQLDPGKLKLFFGDGTPPASKIASNSPLAESTWYQVAAVRAAGTFKLYVNGLLQADTSTDPVGDGGLDLAFGSTDLADLHLDGRGSWWAIFDRALSSEELIEMSEAGSTDPGDVLIIDPETGEPVWGPPGTEVEHGDGDPEEDPVTGHDAFLGPVDGAGWHLQLHYEYVVVYDSSPGRFDVPSRKWTRVPFNTVRVYRSWEHAPAGSGSFTEAWLPEDRGLTEHAKNGLLLVTPGMLFNFQWLSGWFSFEYPAVDYFRLPNSTGGDEGFDNYVRAARMTNVTNGSVLRRGTPGIWGELRAFIEYGFSETDEAQGMFWPIDNPYPNYPHWAARPLNKPLPYPKLSNAESLANYLNSVGSPGFRLDYLLSERPPVAGDAISLQAWQDSPWPLRFGTDKYPPYKPADLVQQWRNRPCLVLFHQYDPATVDHATGALI